jgi:hypothetical protein
MPEIFLRVSPNFSAKIPSISDGLALKPKMIHNVIQVDAYIESWRPDEINHSPRNRQGNGKTH